MVQRSRWKHALHLRAPNCVTGLAPAVKNFVLDGFASGVQMLARDGRFHVLSEVCLCLELHLIHLPEQRRSSDGAGTNACIDQAAL